MTAPDARVIAAGERVKEAAERIPPGHRASWSNAGGFGGHSAGARIIADEINALDTAAIVETKL